MEYLGEFIIDSDIYDWVTAIIEDPNNFSNIVTQAKYTALLNIAAGAMLLQKAQLVYNNKILRSMDPKDFHKIIRARFGYTERDFKTIFNETPEKIAWRFEHFIKECERLKTESERVLNVSYLILAILSYSTQEVIITPNMIDEISKERKITDPYRQKDPGSFRDELFFNPGHVGLTPQSVAHIILAYQMQDPSMVLNVLNTAANIPIQSKINVPVDAEYQLQIVENMAVSLRSSNELYLLTHELDESEQEVSLMWQPERLYENSPHMDLLYYYPDI